MDAGMYERALKHTGAVVAGTTKEQLDNPTPCTEWSVRDVLNHLIAESLSFAAGGRGQTLPMDDGTDHCADDHVAAFDGAGRDALEEFSQPGALEKEFTMPWGGSPGSVSLGLALTDMVVHGWDIAKGTDQSLDIDDDIAEAVYGMTSQMMEPIGKFPRKGNFKEPVDISDDAPPADKLIAYLGRQP